MWSGIIAHTGAAAGPTVPATTTTQSQSVNWQVPKGPSGALPASQTDTRPSPAPCRAPLCLLSSAKDFVTFPLPQTWQRWGVGEARGSGGARAGQRNVPTGTLARPPTPPVRPRRRAGGPSPAPVRNVLNGSVLVNCPLRARKARETRPVPWHVGGVTRWAPLLLLGQRLVCVGAGGEGSHVCTNSPWIGEGLTRGARPRHRVTLRCGQLQGQGSPLLVVRGSEGEPLASAPVGHHVGRPYVEGGAVRGAGGAVAGGHPARLAAGLTGERRQAASAIPGLGAAGIAGGPSGGCGQLVLLLLLLLVCILLGSALLAAVILRGQWGGMPEG